MDYCEHNAGNVSRLVNMQLIIARHNLHGVLETIHVPRIRRFLIQLSAHEPPALAAILGLGSYYFHLYRVVAFDKLHVVNVGIIRQFVI